jgi:4-methylaminobutanoate oxidase (formaldehyde-forming)
MSWIRANCPSDADMVISDVTGDFAVLGLVGPDTPGIAAAMGAGWLNDIGYFRHQTGEIAGISVHAARLSYVGESGWELTCDSGDASRLYACLAAAGVVPVGAYAQTAMRIEKGFFAYGHDLDTDVTPAMAGLEFVLSPDKDFIGSAALAAMALPATRLVSLDFEDVEAVPLGNEPVCVGGAIIGKTTSAAFGYRIGKPVALARIASDHAVAGSKVTVNIAGHHSACRVVLGPLFDEYGLRMRGAVA